ncbi:hypothetical protein GCM10009557_02090 [Virgisporangium ochraceum]|uniref:Uncharacterized protein n=1 Tax=Virgisporangium ochraceum TaxID=65505 RepID=A0A8J4ED25_9ACTN|nr:hypothetical protein [Virgisporangium ochraceum]GIJ70138.1 hypothetical protein Voc01_050550 [Virgisporangium ochraceum]
MKIIEGEIVHVGASVPPAGRSFPVVVSVVLLAATVVLGTLLVRERSARDDDNRHLRAQNARSVQRAAALGAELAVVRAQRDEAVSRLIEEDGLSAEAVAAIRACVLRYAEYERTPGGAPTLAQKACANAEPYVR